jgi:hypothetical protein
MHRVKPEVQYRIETTKIYEASESHPLEYGFNIRNGFKYEFSVRLYLFIFGGLRVTSKHIMQASYLANPNDWPTIFMIFDALGIQSAFSKATDLSGLDARFFRYTCRGPEKLNQRFISPTN